MEYLLKASAIIVIFYICYKLFLQRETFFESNRWFLLTGLAVALAMPFIVIPIHITAEASQVQDFIISGKDSATTTISETGFDILQVVIIIYFAGVIFLLSRLIFQFGSLGLLLFNPNKKETDGFIFVKSNKEDSPFSFFKWIVYNPNQFSDGELYQIITHEKVHASQYHSIDILFTQISSIVFWFNPIIWLYKKELQQNLEFIADQNTQEVTNCKKSYQHLLLKTSVPNYQMALTNNFYNSLIKKRIVMLHKNRSKNQNQWKYALVIPILTLFLMSFNTKEIINYKNSPLIEGSVNNEAELVGDTQMVMITKDFTDSDFERVKDRLKKEGITIKIKGIKRNKKNEITDIKIEVTSKQSNANYNTNSEDPIKPIKISFDRVGDNISIGNSSDMHFGEGYSYVIKDGHSKVHTSKKGDNVFVYSTGESEHEVIEDDDKIIIKNGHEIHELKKAHKDQNVFIISDDDKIIDIKSEGNHDKYIVKGDKHGKVKEWKHKDSDNVWIDDDGAKIELKTIDKNNKKIFFSTDGDENPLLIIDGKEVSNKKVDDLDPKNIESMSVIKGDAAIKKYGKKAKDGVIEITTKKPKD